MTGLARVPALLLPLAVACGSSESEEAPPPAPPTSDASVDVQADSVTEATPDSVSTNDSAPDAEEERDAGCPTGQADTVEGCMPCDDIIALVTAESQAAKEANDECTVPEDCFFSVVSTTCVETCAVPVADLKKYIYGTAIDNLANDYCADFDGRCSATPAECTPAIAVCENGHCGSVPDA